MILKHKLPAYTSVITLLVGAVCAYLIMTARQSVATTPITAPPIATGSSCDYSVNRINGFGHVQPLLSAESVCEGPRYAPLKASVMGLMNGARSQGTISRASVYVMDLQKDDWFSINGDERYEPASLMKVPSMITALMNHESDASFSQRPFRAAEIGVELNQQYPPVQEPEVGKDYTLDQVLQYSIVHSSNIAETMLLRQIDVPQYQRLLAMVGLQSVSVNESSYPISPKEYARFLKAIYSTAVLSPLNAEWAMNLLIASDFDHGIRRGVPGTVDVASKFGETGTTGSQQLHEAAVVFAPGRTYLVVVMTHGPETPRLAELIASISAEVYGSMVPATGRN